MREFSLAVLAAIVAPLFPVQAAPPAHEKFQYSVEWRLIEAGRVTVDSSPATVRNTSGQQIRLLIESVGLVSRLYKVEDLYTISMQRGFCAADVFVRSQEGRRQRETRITFDGARRKASYLETDTIKRSTVLQKEISVPPCVHDVIGGLFALRDRHVDLGHFIEMPVSDGKKFAMAKVEAQERETVKTPAGTFQTVRYEAYLFDGVLFNKKGRLQVWFTDDDRRIPVQFRFRLGLAVGTINVLLTKEEHR